MKTTQASTGPMLSSTALLISTTRWTVSKIHQHYLFSRIMYFLWSMWWWGGGVGGGVVLGTIVFMWSQYCMKRNSVTRAHDVGLLADMKWRRARSVFPCRCFIIRFRCSGSAPPSFNCISRRGHAGVSCCHAAPRSPPGYIWKLSSIQTTQQLPDAISWEHWSMIIDFQPPMFGNLCSCEWYWRNMTSVYFFSSFWAEKRVSLSSTGSNIHNS